MGGRRWNTSKESIASPEGKLISALRLVRSYGACEPLARAVPEGRFLLRSEDLCRLLSGLGEAIWRVRRAAQRTTFRVCALAPGRVGAFFHFGRWVTSDGSLERPERFFPKQVVVQTDAVRTAPSFGGTSRPPRRTQTWVNSTPSRKISAE
jgi:hypothetical protein